MNMRATSDDQHMRCESPSTTSHAGEMKRCAASLVLSSKYAATALITYINIIGFSHE